MPKKFKFRLEQVLNYRNVVRDEKKGILAERNKELRSLEDRMFELKSGLKKEQNSAHDQISDSLQIASLYIERVVNEIEHQLNLIDEKKKEVEEARLNYIEAHKEVEILEKLKEKQSNEYYDHISNEEGKFLDELSVLRSNKR